MVAMLPPKEVASVKIDPAVRMSDNDILEDEMRFTC